MRMYAVAAMNGDSVALTQPAGAAVVAGFAQPCEVTSPPSNDSRTWKYVVFFFARCAVNLNVEFRTVVVATFLTDLMVKPRYRTACAPVTVWPAAVNLPVSVNVFV